ncbi:CubicO group peptidase, beta-lactamase class C family [Lutibacter flavus]|uniref:CubicO group peptidase, beta-lactamase class C family n=1 Tax=Lutibacter flavus TaxID=691689 RepID=A0A238XCJ6_9FLAO|nr:CubicO group peptidase, beta-lactamase class C family [Lutibacter flavus]
MKKGKILLLIILLLTIGVIWIIEPLSLNPFSQIEIPETQSEIDFNCKDSSFAVNNELESKANKIIDEHMASNNFLGVTTGLYIENCGTYVSGAGFTNKADQKRINSNTLGRIASITKPMTAIAIMQLHEKGILDLDTPIQTYLKEFPKKAKGDITIRHLLKHTSGISHYSSKWDALSFTHYPTLVNAMDAFKDKELLFEPGTQYMYSSYGYAVLGAIIEKVSQMSYGKYMKKYIWDIAGMSNTSLEEDKQKYSNNSRGYLKIKSTYIKSPKTDLSIIYSAGGVQSTAKDLLKFGEAVLHNKLIKSTTLEMMINATDELAPAIGDDPYGFGWAVYDDPKYGKIIQHGGTQPGTSAFFSIYLDQKIVSVVLSNCFGTRQNVFNLSRDIAYLALEK